jgi:GNAT superfamily N-acetyltransferase
MSNLSPEIVQRFVRYGANTRNFMPFLLKNPSWPAETSAEYPGSFSMRTAAAGDVEGLAEYFGNLSHTSRYNRFMGAVNNFSKIALDCLIHCSNEDRFTLLAELKEPSKGAIVGEASYAFDCESGYGEFAISVSDRWQRHGLGLALLVALQFRAVGLGHFPLFGETLRTNDQMKRLARRAGFEFTRSLDWRAIRFDKTLSG